jgi:predicted DNA-binding transcriptional regulator AlpA
VIETMNVTEIAALVRMKRTTVAEQLIKRPDFPKPWFGRCAKHRLWRTEDVLAWVTQGQSRDAMSSDDAR